MGKTQGKSGKGCFIRKSEEERRQKVSKANQLRWSVKTSTEQEVEEKESVEGASAPASAEWVQPTWKESLCADIAGYDYPAHDAVEDVKALQRLTTHLSHKDLMLTSIYSEDKVSDFTMLVI